ncbi:MAG TPA: hypothetical protein VN752_03505 [Solirubrobacterales bacterium]|nr:hypothetical protein [Solirubrobacterales bacterium]
MITKDQRAGLYELVCNHLYSVDDLWTALGRSRDYATAERLGLEFTEDFRLLNDIGWDPGDRRESFELTIPVHDLVETLKRLHDEAEAVLGESPAERRSREEDEATNERLRSGLDACEELLVALDESGGDSA